MTTASDFSNPGFTHELLLHDSLEEMLAFVLPFVRDGVAAQEPTLFNGPPGNRDHGLAHGPAVGLCERAARAGLVWTSCRRTAGGR